MLEQCSSCWWQWWRDDACLFETAITPLAVHEYNEGFYQLNMHPGTCTESGLNMSGLCVRAIRWNLFHLSFVLVAKRRCLALWAGCTTTLAVDGCTCTWIHRRMLLSIRCVCEPVVLRWSSSGMLVYDSHVVFLQPQIKCGLITGYGRGAVPRTLPGRYLSRRYILECHDNFVLHKRPTRALKDQGTKERNLTCHLADVCCCMTMLNGMCQIRRIVVSTEWLHGWSVAKLHGYWRAALKFVQHTTGSHTQPWLIPFRVDAMNRILRCAHVQQGVWYKGVFPNVSCLPYWKQITVPDCEANTNSCCWSYHQYMATSMDHSRQCFCTVCHSVTLQLLQGLNVNAGMLVSNAQPSATVKSRALIRLNSEGGDDQ